MWVYLDSVLSDIYCQSAAALMRQEDKGHVQASESTLKEKLS